MTSDFITKAAAPAMAPMLLTPRQAAAALAICERSLFTLSKRGEIPAIKIGKSVRYDPRDLAAFIARLKSGANAAQAQDGSPC